MIDVRADKVKPSLRIPFQFRADPVSLRGRGVVSEPAVSLFAVILDEARRRRWRSKLTNAALAARMGRCVATVKRLLAELEAAGLIRRDMAAEGRIRLAIVVTWEGAGELATGRASSGQAVSRGAAKPLTTIQSLPPSGEGNQRGASAPGGGAAPEERGRDLTPAEFRAARELMRRGQFSDLALARLMGMAEPPVVETPRVPVRPDGPTVDRPAVGVPGCGAGPIAAAPPCPDPETTDARPPAREDGRHKPRDPNGSPGRGPENLPQASGGGRYLKRRPIGRGFPATVGDDVASAMLVDQLGDHLALRPARHDGGDGQAAHRLGGEAHGGLDRLDLASSGRLGDGATGADGRRGGERFGRHGDSPDGVSC